ncbi:MAG: Activator of Hsp90 ATPase 1 family protein [Crocinitomicaceae bacterium]|nr:Activator of Hsp90 ATPase 1 family protein [Crocinitomicaceae bacterium]
MDNQQTTVVKDFNEKSVKVSREFKAGIQDVWRCYSEPELLDQWWGPAPWRAETKTMKFEAGGFWLYAMVSPEGQKHWGIMNYIDIERHKNINLEDGFCDENGNLNKELPVSKGEMVFTSTATGTLVEFKMTYTTDEQLKTIIEMGFEQGITICLEQLSNLLTRLTD